MKYARSGQYQLLKVMIRTNTANPVEIDLMTAFTDAAIYESIFNHTMSGNVSFVDTNNLVQKYGLGSGEIVEIEWSTAGIEESTIRTFGEVYDISEPTNLNDHTSGYTLHFASPETITAIKKKLFTGHKDSCSNIVTNVFDRIKRGQPIPTKPLIAEATRNIEHIVFTGQTALSGIQMLTDRAVSSSNQSGFMFYENNREFRFTPIELLYSKEPVIEYSYRSSSAYEDVKNAHEESANTFQDFEIERSNKFLEDIMDGQYGSSWAYLSVFDKSLNVVNYDAKKEFNSSTSLGKAPILLDRNFNPDYSDRLTISYSHEHEPNEPWCVSNKMKLLKTNTLNVNIGVFGSSFIKVGDVCLASIPSFSSEDFTDESFDAVSGKFLIAEIKHILTPKSYNQRIRLIKDAFEEVLS